MKRYLVCERASLGQVYDGIGLELWACGNCGESLFSCLGQDLATLRSGVPLDTDFTAFNGGTSTGEGSDYWISLLSAESSSISSQDLHHRSALSYNHPDPFTSTTSIQFSLPRASSSGIAVYEATALLANMLLQGRQGD